MKRADKIGIFFWGMCCVMIIAISFYLEANAPSRQPIGVTKGMVNFCESPNIEETADCLSKFVQSFYIGRERKDSEDVTFEMLFTEGGDCKNWADFYEEAGELLGKDTQQITLPARDGQKHRFTIISDKTGYCIMDNQFSGCALYGDDEE